MTPSAYSNRIKNLRNLAQKLAFSPAGAMPPMDPAMMGGMPPQGAPMDPAMMGGMPPQGAPMDPAMMGGMPPQGAPMDPAMMGGMPPQGATMDPAMMGGVPPEGGAQSPEMTQLLDMVQAMGYLLTKICKKLDISITPEDQQADAEKAMLNPDEQAELDAQQAYDNDMKGALSDQAEEEVMTDKPGYLQDTIGQFQAE